MKASLFLTLNNTKMDFIWTTQDAYVFGAIASTIVVAAVYFYIAYVRENP